MKLCFIDETSGIGKNGDYFAICGAILSPNYYCELKKKIICILEKYNWPDGCEFKGNIIFDPSLTDQEKENRYQIAKEILELNKGKSNAKIKFCYVSTKIKRDRKNYYLDCLPLILDKLLIKTQKDSSKNKNLLGLYCDNYCDINSSEIFNKIKVILQKKDLILIEEPVIVFHGVQNIGILFADLFAYFAGRLHINGKEIKDKLDRNVPIDIFEDLNIVKSVAKSQEILG
ncbi:TPA: hypothetical protein ACT9HO_002794, partial [Legionella pneumophila]